MEAHGFTLRIGLDGPRLQGNPEKGKLGTNSGIKENNEPVRLLQPHRRKTRRLLSLRGPQQPRGLSFLRETGDFQKAETLERSSAPCVFEFTTFERDFTQQNNPSIQARCQCSKEGYCWAGLPKRSGLIETKVSFFLLRDWGTGSAPPCTQAHPILELKRQGRQGLGLRPRPRHKRVDTSKPPPPALPRSMLSC